MLAGKTSAVAMPRSCYRQRSAIDLSSWNSSMRIVRLLRMTDSPFKLRDQTGRQSNSAAPFRGSFGRDFCLQGKVVSSNLIARSILKVFLVFPGAGSHSSDADVRVVAGLGALTGAVRVVAELPRREPSAHVARQIRSWLAKNGRAIDESS
jgi:hypothetical protein